MFLPRRRLLEHVWAVQLLLSSLTSLLLVVSVVSFQHSPTTPTTITGQWRLVLHAFEKKKTVLLGPGHPITTSSAASHRCGVVLCSRRRWGSSTADSSVNYNFLSIQRQRMDADPLLGFSRHWRNTGGAAQFGNRFTGLRLHSGGNDKVEDDSREEESSSLDPSQNGNNDQKDKSKEEEEEEEEEEEDWRAFRARLVMQQKRELASSTTATGGEAATATPYPTEKGRSASSSWAYEAGDAIETGSIILSRVEQDFGYGLRQQYFHKCVILVLSHDNEFTKGIILNRPTDLILSDDDFLNDDGTPLVNSDSENLWKIWFGGEVRWIDSEEPDIVCLHSLKSEEAMEISEHIMKDIQWTSFDGARMLVNAGLADPTDFWVFCGYCGWGPGQLMDELQRESWYMAAADSRTLLKELEKQSIDSDPRDAGLSTWNSLMDMIGRSEEGRETEGGFDDMMLREWAREQLFFDSDDDQDESSDDETGGIREGGSSDDAFIDDLLKRATKAGKVSDVGEGSIVRGSSARHSPFLLSDQEFHKSLVLVTQDDNDVTVGVLLNHPTTKTVKLKIFDETSGMKKTVSIPQRYGGRYGIKGEADKPLFFLHCKDALREARVGAPVGADVSGLWKCREEHVSKAIGSGIAAPEDFVAISGFSIWEKVPGGIAGGMRGEVWAGNFEVVSPNRTSKIWESLISQELLSAKTIDNNHRISKLAWGVAGYSDEDDDTKETDVDDFSLGSPDEKITDETEDQNFVLNTNVTVSTLADIASKSWVATFLLGDPGLRRETSI